MGQVDNKNSAIVKDIVTIKKVQVRIDDNAWRAHIVLNHTLNRTLINSF